MEKSCGFEGCKNLAAGKLCQAHYTQKRKTGELKPVRYRAPNGAGSVNSGGYRKIYKPEHPNANRHGVMAEHRYIMSEILGRPLLDIENVHHINGDKLDNRPENLELWITYQPPGQRKEDLVKWAKEVLEIYGD